MKIFIDTAKLEEIEQAASYGILDGVTTNPSLIKAAVADLKSKGEEVNMKEYITKILNAAKGTPVSLEVVGDTYDTMISEGKKLFKTFNPVSNNVVIKIPVNPATENSNDFDGIKAIKELSSNKIPINTTLIFTPEQAMLAAKAGASYVSPFAGRIDDYIRKDMTFDKTDYFPEDGWKKGDLLLEDNGVVSGVDLVAQIVEMFSIYDTKTEVLAASLRNTRQVRECALAGAHIATLPLNVIQDLMKHYKTVEGMKNFTKDAVPEYKELL